MPRTDFLWTDYKNCFRATRGTGIKTAHETHQWTPCTSEPERRLWYGITPEDDVVFFQRVLDYALPLCGPDWHWFVSLGDLPQRPCDRALEGASKTANAVHKLLSIDTLDGASISSLKRIADWCSIITHKASGLQNAPEIGKQQLWYGALDVAPEYAVRAALCLPTVQRRALLDLCRYHQSPVALAQMLTAIAAPCAAVLELDALTHTQGD
jgi:hypothetical protein